MIGLEVLDKLQDVYGMVKSKEGKSVLTMFEKGKIGQANGVASTFAGPVYLRSV